MCHLEICMGMEHHVLIKQYHQGVVTVPNWQDVSCGNYFAKFVCLLWSICNHEIFFLLLSFGYTMFNIISIITQKRPCCIHLNLSIVLTKLIYNTIQTLKQKNQPNPRKNGLHMAYKLTSLVMKKYLHSNGPPAYQYIHGMAI